MIHSLPIMTLYNLEALIINGFVDFIERTRRCYIKKHMVGQNPGPTKKIMSF